MGLKGLLIARGSGEARLSPIDRLAKETETVLGSGLSLENKAELSWFLDSNSRTRDGRLSIAAMLIAVAGMDSDSQDMARSPLVLAIAAASTEAPERARSLAARWGAIDAADDPDTVLAPNLLLGLARLLARDDAVLEGIHENDDLVLTLIDGEGSERVSEVFSVNEKSFRTAIPLPLGESSSCMVFRE